MRDRHIVDSIVTVDICRTRSAAVDGARANAGDNKYIFKTWVKITERETLATELGTNGKGWCSQCSARQIDREKDSQISNLQKWRKRRVCGHVKRNPRMEYYVVCDVGTIRN